MSLMICRLNRQGGGELDKDSEMLRMLEEMTGAGGAGDAAGDAATPPSPK